MKNRRELTPAARRLLDIQAGVIGRAQANGLGLGDKVLWRLARQGVLWPLGLGLYSENREPGWLGLAWGGVLLGGPSATLGLGTAARLHGLSKSDPDPIEVWTGTHRCRVSDPRFMFRRGVRVGIGEPSRTRVDDTLLDLCARADEDEITRLIADALSSRKTTAQRLATALTRRGRIPHRALLRDVLGDVAEGVHSPLERRFQVAVVRPHGLPVGHLQASSGRNRHDVRHPEFALIVELDGRQYHQGGARYDDMNRDAAATLRGERTLRFGWWHTSREQACATASWVALALQQGGWSGEMSRCPRCA